MRSAPHHPATPLLQSSAPPPIVWTIAGSDSGGGAGIQGDLKTMTALGVHGCSVITAITAQNTNGVRRIHSVTPQMIWAQIDALHDDLPPAAIKIGMLGKTRAIKILATYLRKHPNYVVCDPVMSATRGGRLLEERALSVLKRELFPCVALLTPNLPEAERLLGIELKTSAAIESAANQLLSLGVRAVLIKGGHADGALSQDFWTNGKDKAWLNSPRIPTPHTHGGGCVLSSAIAAAHALGYGELDAVVIGKAYINQGLRHAGGIGRGRGPLAHLSWPDTPADLPWITSTAAHSRTAFPAAGKMGLYPIVDSADWIDRLLPLGIDMVQLRIKNLCGAALESEIARAAAAARKFKARLYINDHWQLALKNKVFGVHIGQDDLASTDISALQKAGLRLGVSTHGYAEVARAKALRPSYLAIGTLFKSPSKTFAHAPLGVSAFARLRKLVAAPVVAIGGITCERAADVSAAGADGLAVISDITKAKDLAARVRQWQKVTFAE